MIILFSLYVAQFDLLKFYLGFVKTLLRILYLSCAGILVFSFTLSNVFDVGIRVIMASKFGSYCSFSMFWKKICKIGIISLSNIWYNLLLKSSSPGIFMRQFLSTNLISLLDTGLLLMRLLSLLKCTLLILAFQRTFSYYHVIEFIA